MSFAQKISMAAQAIHDSVLIVQRVLFVVVSRRNSLLITVSILGSICHSGSSFAASVSAAQRTSCVVNNTGDLYCWGGNDRGQLGDGTLVDRVVPVRILPAAAWRSVTAAEGHTCAVRTDGTLWCWGDNRQGELGLGAAANPLVPVPTQVGTQKWISVGAGRYHNCGIQGTSTSGSLWCWGQNTFGQLGSGDYSASPVPNQIGTATNWTGVTAGGLHSCALNSSTTQNLFCWGSNERGQLGTGNVTTVIVPTAVGATAWSQISAGEYSTCGLQPVAAGKTLLSCWGANDNGQLGNGTTVDSSSPLPVTTPNNTHYSSVSVGDRHACGILASDLNQATVEALCWGNNIRGELGIGSNTQQAIPNVVALSPSVIAIAAGGEHTCAIGLAGNNVVSCWGQRLAGQLGDSIGKTTPTTATVVNVTSWQGGEGLIGSGGNTTCAVGPQGVLYCFGRGGAGQIGDGGARDRVLPISDGTPSTGAWTTVAGGDRHFCALEKTATSGVPAGLQRTLYCWGAAESKRLGQAEPADQLTPTTLSAPTFTNGPTHTQTDWISVAAGASHGCAIAAYDTTYQRLLCWGDNTYGQVGVGTASPVSVGIRQVGTDTDGLWRQVAAGGRHSCATKANGSLWCWGDNARGQLGTGTSNPAAAPAQVGSAIDWRSVYAAGDYTCAIKTGGTLWCWGDNRASQLGIGTFEIKSSPAQVGTATTWSTLGLGSHHACGIQTTQGGTLLCWGSNGRSESTGSGGGILTVPTVVSTTYGWTNVAANDDDTCAVNGATGPMTCMGSDFNGQQGDANAWAVVPVTVIFPPS